MAVQQRWFSRSPDRLPDEVWQATLARVRGEFSEMPCMRVTAEQASALLGLQQPASRWILERLARDGFLSRTAQGEYMRRNGAP
jgi:predicted transcriptional regulator of viral defense system